jgi:hypothetical protein
LGLSRRGSINKGKPMKLSNIKNSHSTNNPGESHDFQIGDPGVIIEILRNRLYRYPIRTLVQEYISNARDAVREAGLPDHKLVVTAPTAQNPSFSVRDFGVGISPDRMKNVFVLYGASTKRDSNKQVGGFGIGAKSAWAYADSFSVITRIDGIQRQYLAHIGSKNHGVLEFIAESATTEENGTEIIVPVKSHDIENFHSAIQRCVFFWEQRPTLVNLQESEWFKTKYFLNQDGITLFTDISIRDYRVFESSNRFLVVDGIPYDANNFALRDIGVNNCFAAIHCKTGDVGISASREGLSDTPDNHKVIEEITKKANQKIAQIRLKDCEKTKDIKSYLNKLAHWYRYTENVSDVKPKYGVQLDKNGYLCINNEVVKGLRWTQNGQKLSSRSDCAVCLDDLRELPMFILLDKEMGKASYTTRVRQALILAGVKTAFGFKGTSHEIFDHKITDLKIVRKPKVGGTTNRSPNKIYNLQRYDGYKFESNYENFGMLSSCPNKFIYVDLDINRATLNNYYEVARLTNRLLVGVGAQAKKAIEEAKLKHPLMFVTPQEILDDPKKTLGSEYKKISLLAQKKYASNLNNKNMDLFLDFIELPHILKSLNNLKDVTFRENFLKVAPIFKKNYKYENYRLPQDLYTKIVSDESEMMKEINLATLLGELLSIKVPFLSSCSGSDWSEEFGNSLINCLNLLIASERK